MFDQLSVGTRKIRSENTRQLCKHKLSIHGSVLTDIISLITLKHVTACVHGTMSARMHVKMMSDVKDMKEVDVIFGETLATRAS